MIPDFSDVDKSKYKLVVIILLFAAIPGLLRAGEPGDIHIDVTTHLGDVHRFYDGDLLSFLVSIDTDAYLAVIYQDAGGNSILLLPNIRQKNNLYKKGIYLSIPEADAGFTFKIQAPFGKERLWVFASVTPMPLLKGKALPNGLMRLSSNIAKIRKRIKASAMTAYGETRLELYTSRRK